MNVTNQHVTYEKYSVVVSRWLYTLAHLSRSMNKKLESVGKVNIRYDSDYRCAVSNSYIRKDIRI